MFCTIAIIIFSFHLCVQANLRVDVRATTQERQSTTLQDIISEVNRQSLNKTDRLAIIDNAAIVLEQYNPHRFIHLNYLKVDPAKMLRDLKPELDTLSNFEFHRRVARIFSLMGDLHTVYDPPSPLRRSLAFLGFFIFRYYQHNQTTPTYFIPEENLTVIAIDGVPVHKLAVQLGTRGFGSNRASRIANGVVALTCRSLVSDRIPRDANATLLVNNGVSDFVVNRSWNFLTIPLKDEPAVSSRTALESHFLFSKVPRDLRWEFYRSYQTKQLKNLSNIHTSDPIITRLPVSLFVIQIFKAFEIFTSSSTYGYITLKTFDLSPPPNFAGDSFKFYNFVLLELFKTLQNMSYKAVVVDISGNPGGFAYFAKPVFEYLTDKNVPPTPIVFRATNLTLSMFSLHSNRGDDMFRPAVKQFYEIGEQFTGPITYLFNYKNLYDGIFRLPRGLQAFSGKLIVVTDALSYSASDLFASWVKDTNAGLVVGLDEATGGGGATVRPFSELKSFYPRSFPSKMPSNVEFYTASIRLFRNGMRVGGTLVENFGVSSMKRYFVTFRDVIDRKKDFLNYLGKQVQNLA